MNGEHAWEEATIDLIRRLEQDKLPKAEQRLASAQRGIDAVKRQIDALHIALDVYRNEHGLAKPGLEPPDPELAAAFQGMSVKEMLHHWAGTHDGRVIMKDAAKFLAAAGLFRDETQAAGALYPAAHRSDDFEKVTRGVYRRRSQPAVAARIEEPMDEGETDANDFPTIVRNITAALDSGLQTRPRNEADDQGTLRAVPL